MSDRTPNLLSPTCITPRELTVSSVLVTSLSLTNKKTYCRRTNPSPCSEPRGLSSAEVTGCAPVVAIPEKVSFIPTDEGSWAQL